MARVIGKRLSVRWSGALAASLLAPLVPLASAAPAGAQTEDEFAIELFGGAVTYGRFVEQLASEGIGALRERELRAGIGPTFGGTVGITTSLLGIDDISAQLGFQWTSSEFEFELDDPRVVGELEDAEVGAFVTYIVSGSILKYFGDASDTFAPYAVVGFNGTWWSLDQDEPVTGGFGRVQPTSDGEGTVFRFGPTGGLGLQIRAADEFALRLETTRHSIRNPFDGDGESAYNITTGQKIDEPDRVSVTRYTLGLVYLLRW